MTLADLIDLEARIASEGRDDSDALRARDRDIARGIDVASRKREPLLRAWLAALRKRERGPSAGQRVVAGYNTLGALLFVVGIVIGWGAVSAVLAYDGTHPVNVLMFVTVLVGTQVGFALVGMLTAVVRRFFPGLFGVQPLITSALRAAATRLAGLFERRGVDTKAWEATLQHVRTRRSLYRSVEQSVLYGLSQTFGIAFNLGAIACCVFRITFSDIAFSWSTTLDLAPETVLGIVQLIASPWGWLAPDTVPTAELVEASQYSRFHGNYVVGTPDARLVGQWWPFLVATLVVYGLLLRLVLAIAAVVGREWALGHLPLGTPDVERIVRRLQTPVVDTRAPLPEAEPGPRAVGRPGVGGPAAPRPREGHCAVVAWRDAATEREALDRIVGDRLGLAIDAFLAAGTSDYASDQAALDGIRADASERQAVLVLAEAWEAPDQALGRFLEKARDAVGPEQHLIVALVDAGDADQAGLDAWRDWVAGLRDPYLGLEVLAAA